jgi:hypothetical protein
MAVRVINAGGQSGANPAQVNAQVDVALNTAIPAAPTAGSINQRLVAIDTLTEAGGAGDLAAVLADTLAIDTLTAAGGDGDLAAIKTSVDLLSTLLIDNNTRENGTASYNSGTSGVYSAWQQLIASTSGATQFARGSMYGRENSGGVITYHVELAVGAASSESVIAKWSFRLAASGVGAWIFLVPFDIPAGTRLATRSVVDVAAAANANMVLDISYST